MKLTARSWPNALARVAICIAALGSLSVVVLVAYARSVRAGLLLLVIQAVPFLLVAFRVIQELSVLSASERALVVGAPWRSSETLAWDSLVHWGRLAARVRLVFETDERSVVLELAPWDTVPSIDTWLAACYSGLETKDPDLWKLLKGAHPKDRLT